MSETQPSQVSPKILAVLLRYDTPTVADAVFRHFRRPENYYTDQRLRHMLPELGSFIGYAVTAEVTTNDEDSPAVSFADHYRNIERVKGPVVAVFKDVDSRPGRGASFGEVMSVLHRRFGTVGVLIDGTVRDLQGLRKRKFPAMASGAVSGHGRFKPTRLNVPVTVCDLRIHPGDLLMADINGCVKIPTQHIAAILKTCRELVARERTIIPFIQRNNLDRIAGRFAWESK